MKFVNINIYFEVRNFWKLFKIVKFVGVCDAYEFEPLGGNHSLECRYLEGEVFCDSNV